jgi:lipid II:glycine glycyltransferase (peptidoglycan interpeptide bridge formation enzyme)
VTTKSALIAAGIVGTLALGTGGYFANEWRVCRGMEQDFLRSVEGYTSNVYLGALASTVGVKVDREEQESLRNLSLKVQQMQLTAIYERCGDESGRAAADLASDEVRDSMKDALLIP